MWHKASASSHSYVIHTLSIYYVPMRCSQRYVGNVLTLFTTKNTTPISAYTRRHETDKTRWRHATNPHIPTESLQFRHLSSVTCIYGTRAWGARGPGFEIRIRHHDFCSSFCLLSSSFSSFPKTNTKWVRVKKHKLFAWFHWKHAYISPRLYGCMMCVHTRHM